MKMQLASYLTIFSGIIILFINYVSANSQNWKSNFEEAKVVAKAKNNPILMVFQGSDWCSPGMRLEKYILNSKPFQAYTNSKFTLMKVDFPQRKINQLPLDQETHNMDLAKAYNTKGIFPYMVVVDSYGEILGSLEYDSENPDDYIKKLESIVVS